MANQDFDRGYYGGAVVGGIGGLVAAVTSALALVYITGTTGLFGTKTACIYKLCLTIMP